MTKAEARQQLRGLPSLAVEEAARRSDSICEQVRAHPAWAGARVAALYQATRHEPSLDQLWENDARRIFVFPRVVGESVSGEMLAFYRVLKKAELIESRWGLREPAVKPETEVQPSEIDLVVVPGVAFTQGGERLGRGRGHYDRFLPRLRADATVIGVCFRERLLPELPSEAHDCRMHVVISA